MALEGILENIINNAAKEADKIILEAKTEAEGIIRQARKEAEMLYQESLSKQGAFCEKEKQRIIINARLEARKNLLLAKQEFLDTVFDKLKQGLGKTQLKKQQISYEKVQDVYEDMDFYLAKIRPDYETEIAAILFP